METAAGVFVVAAITTSGHDNFAAEDEIPVGPAVALSVNWKHQRNNKNRIPGTGLAQIEFVGNLVLRVTPSSRSSR